MLTFFKRLLGLAPTPVNTPEVKTVIVAPAPQRAKDAQGRFQADDPATPENEAWVGGVAPAKNTAKVRAITANNSASEAIKSASANKRRRPRRNNKVKADAAATKTTDNSQVKPAQVAKAKPAKSKAPEIKK
jgi:hypothetical protein